MPSSTRLLIGIFGILILATAAFPQSTPPLNIFQTYFVTGDYVVGGWQEQSSNGTYATGLIKIPDTTLNGGKQPVQPGVVNTVPPGAEIVAAYLYWATVEGNQTSFAGQNASFNGFAIKGTILGNPNAPTSWSAGGCSGNSQGSKTMRTYRADVRPLLPFDTTPGSPTYGQILPNTTYTAQFADSGSNGNTQPNALGATLVIIYRVLSYLQPAPLNSIVLYDGSYAPSNASQTMTQQIMGIYQAASSPVAKITHIVANGQPNKSEYVYLNSTSQPLPSLYGASVPPFPGIYGTWDNPTWSLSQYGYVKAGDPSETTMVIPSSSNSGCVSWGAIVLSSTVQDTDNDGLLDVWETNQGYTDVVSGQPVSLPGANPKIPDIFIEVDYLSNMDGKAGAYLHSHLPKQAALDKVGAAFKAQGVNVHFDVGNVYQGLGDTYVIPFNSNSSFGGNPISEGLFVCTDGTTLCVFPNQPVVAWKGDLLYVRDNATVPTTNIPLGNFQPGRGQSYHYMLFGHALGEPRSFWSTAGNALANGSIPQLISIVNSGTTATITLQSPAGVLKPGDQVLPGNPAYNDGNLDRITISGALGQTALNGTYHYSVQSGSTTGTITTTILTITTSGVANGTYAYNPNNTIPGVSNEPQLGVTYAGPTSTSGHSDFAGGGDSAITFGLWGADDPPGPPSCQGDPSQPLVSGQAYCNNQMGTVQQQAGTLMHELGHTLTLTHGGMYFSTTNFPFVPSFAPNCKPNMLSIMSYLFQARGFPDFAQDGSHPIDYSGQLFADLGETTLNESTGIGADGLGLPAQHYTRWYAPPNAVDLQICKSLKITPCPRYALSHCDGTAITDSAQMVRVDGSTYSAPIDWNNDLIVPDAVNPEDVNFDGFTGQTLQGFNDWSVVDFRQIGARANAFGLSGGGGISQYGGGGISQYGGGGIGQYGGGGIGQFGGGGISQFGGGGIGQFGGGGIGQFGGGGVDQSSDTANSTVDPPTNLYCTNCTFSSGTLTENGKSVPLAWTSPSFGQIRKYYVWRAVGSYTSGSGSGSVVSNASAFSIVQTLSGNPPSPTYTDNNLKNKTYYTYFVTDSNKQGALSGASNPVTVYVVF